MACNLAVTMAMAGKRIVLVDGDLRLPRVHEYFAMPNEIGLSSIIAGTSTLADALRPYDLPTASRDGQDELQQQADRRLKTARRLVVLTSGPQVPDPGELVASDRFGSIIHELQMTNVDYVIIDSPALLEVGDAAAMAARVEGLLVVTSLDKARRPVLEEAHDVLSHLPCRKLGIVMTAARVRTSHYQRRYATAVRPTASG